MLLKYSILITCFALLELNSVIGTRNDNGLKGRSARVNRFHIFLKGNCIAIFH